MSGRGVPGQPPELPEAGTRVSLRYLRPPGSEPSMGDVLGHLLDTGAVVRVRTAEGQVCEFRHADVIYVRRLTDRPVRNSQIRAVEHAAALAWPGTEHHWLDGWLLRAGGGTPIRANSAIPLDMFAAAGTVPAIIDWYAQRGLPSVLTLPERLLRVADDHPAECESRTLVGDVDDLVGTGRDTGPLAAPTLSPAPDADWASCYGRDIDADVLTAVGSGEQSGAVVFATIPGAAAARATVTESPNGARWLGLSDLRVIPEQRGRGHAAALCAALRRWGLDNDADRTYAQVRTGESAAAAIGFYTAVGLTPQHRTLHVDARTLLPGGAG